MPPSPRSWNAEIVASILIALVVGILVPTAIYAPSPRVPEGPQINAPGADAIELGPPWAGYLGSHSISLLNLTEAWADLSWGKLQFSVSPGPLSGSGANWSFWAENASSGEIVPFRATGDNWTSASTAPVRVGEGIVVQADAPLVGSTLTVSWPSVGPGEFTVGLR